MDVILIKRQLARRRREVVLIAIAAVLVGLVVAFQISAFPPTFKSRGYDVNTAKIRMLVDTPASQVVDVHPRGSDSLGARASLLSNLMTDGKVEAAIARRAGLLPTQLMAVTETIPGASGPVAPPPTLPSGPDAYLLKTRVLTSTIGDQLPLFEVEAQAPNPAASAALANGAVASLKDYLDSKAATEKVPVARRLRVSALGAAEVSVVHHGPSPVLALVATLFVFGAGCALLVIVDGIQRGRRRAATSEDSPEGDLAELHPLRPEA